MNPSVSSGLPACSRSQFSRAVSGQSQEKTTIATPQATTAR